MTKIDASIGRAAALSTVMDGTCPPGRACNRPPAPGWPRGSSARAGRAGGALRPGDAACGGPAGASGRGPTGAAGCGPAGVGDELPLVVEHLEDDVAVDGLLLDQPCGQPVQGVAVVV